MNCGNPVTFAGRYYCYNLVYYERHKQVEYAIEREKEIKKWSRSKKEALIRRYKSILEFSERRSAGGLTITVISTKGEIYYRTY